MNKYIVFSDFDGTITTEDTICKIMTQFAPNHWKKIWDDIFNKKITISEGVSKLFSLIPSSKKDEIIQFVLNNVQIREGFKEFLLFLKNKNIPFIVISGGLDFYIYPLLAPYKDLIYKIYCNKADFSGKYIKIKFIYDCDPLCDDNDCGMCKISVIRNYKGTKIYIGDSITDINAAKLSDIIFARGLFAKSLRKNNIPYFSYENFYQIKEKMEDILSKNAVKNIR
jgi:2-hydroxy-3-keto-5-methylthiopentenyl-1-phosphate phosphatase